MKTFWKKTRQVVHNLYSGPWWHRIIVWFATLLLLFILFLGAVDINFLWLFGRSPGFSDIKNPVTNDASIILSADSVPIGKFYDENRTPVAFNEISPILVRTLIATEDERFYHHHGIDFQGIFAAIKDMVGGHARGASTITQQLAKNLFSVRTKEEYSTGLFDKFRPTRILSIKLKEWIVATKLEMLFSKEEILTMYFNTVDFGNNAYGIKTACETYFATQPDNRQPPWWDCSRPPAPTTPSATPGTAPNDATWCLPTSTNMAKCTSTATLPPANSWTACKACP